MPCFRPTCRGTANHGCGNRDMRINERTASSPTRTFGHTAFGSCLKRTPASGNHAEPYRNCRSGKPGTETIRFNDLLHLLSSRAAARPDFGPDITPPPTFPLTKPTSLPDSPGPRTSSFGSLPGGGAEVPAGRPPAGTFRCALPFKQLHLAQSYSCPSVPRRTAPLGNGVA